VISGAAICSLVSPSKELSFPFQKPKNNISFRIWNNCLPPLPKAVLSGGHLPIDRDFATA
jgi:hypothetical protein